MAGGVKIDIRGMRELRDAIDSNVEGMQDALGRALLSAAQDIAAESQNLVPFDTGDLAGSMYLLGEMNGVKVDGFPGNTPEFTIAYGTPYALAQHERLDFWHPPKPPSKRVVGGRQGTGTVAPGQPQGPKYLEFPFAEETSQYPTRLIERIRQHYHIQRGREV